MAISESYWLEQICKNLARIADAFEEELELKRKPKPSKDELTEQEKNFRRIIEEWERQNPPPDWVSAPPDYVGDWIPYRRDAKPSDVPLQSSSASSASNK